MPAAFCFRESLGLVRVKFIDAAGMKGATQRFGQVGRDVSIRAGGCRQRVISSETWADFAGSDPLFDDSVDSNRLFPRWPRHGRDTKRMYRYALLVRD